MKILSLRKQILNKIALIKEFDGLNPKTLRWRDVTFNDVHVSKIDYMKLNNFELFNVYNRIIVRHCKQM